MCDPSIPGRKRRLHICITVQKHQICACWRIYQKQPWSNTSSHGDGIAIDDGVWNELCKNKKLISELASYYRTSNVNGVSQIVAQSHPEKLHLLLGKQTYVTLTSEKEVFVNIQTFDHAMQTINGIDGSTSQHWTVAPGANGISLNFDQWCKLTTLEGIFAVEHLKAFKGQEISIEVGHTTRYYPGDVKMDVIA